MDAAQEARRPGLLYRFSDRQLTTPTYLLSLIVYLVYFGHLVLEVVAGDAPARYFWYGLTSVYGVYLIADRLRHAPEPSTRKRGALPQLLLIAFHAWAQLGLLLLLLEMLGLPISEALVLPMALPVLLWVLCIPLALRDREAEDRHAAAAVEATTNGEEVA